MVLVTKLLEGNAGHLAVVELGDPVPFVVRRIYWLYGTPEAATRGLHAHRTLEQVIVPVQGSVQIVLDDVHSQSTYSLSLGSPPLYVGPGTWRVLDDFSADCVLLVLASDFYDASDYIHDYAEFVEWRHTC